MDKHFDLMLNLINRGIPQHTKLHGTIEVCQINKSEALSILEIAQESRPLNPARVFSLTKIMDAGHWKHNDDKYGAPLVTVTETGTVEIDGFQRMKAFLQSSLDTFTIYIKVKEQK
jgi:hypothetical protein